MYIQTYVRHARHLGRQVSCEVFWLLAIPEGKKDPSRQSLCDALVFAPETGRFPGPSCVWATPVV